MHKNRYDYSQTTCSYGAGTNMKIKCPIHGIFEQLANHHYSGSGCQLCGQEYSKLGGSLKKYSSLANQKHSYKYNYAQTKLKGYKELITITCNNCKNNVEVFPIDHLHGLGCNSC